MKNSKFNTLFKTIMEDVNEFGIPNDINPEYNSSNLTTPKKPAPIIKNPCAKEIPIETFIKTLTDNIDFIIDNIYDGSDNYNLNNVRKFINKKMNIPVNENTIADLIQDYPISNVKNITVNDITNEASATLYYLLYIIASADEIYTDLIFDDDIIHIALFGENAGYQVYYDDKTMWNEWYNKFLIQSVNIYNALDKHCYNSFWSLEFPKIQLINPFEEE